MNNKKVTAGILALAMGNIEANLLDDAAKLEERYGAPVRISDDLSNLQTRTYKSGDYIIHAMVANNQYGYGLYEGKTVWQWMIREDRKAMSSTEIEALLDQNPFGGKWVSQGNDKWKMRDVATARYDSFRKSLLERIK